ncbi:MAG: tRNA (adenosine(37)-N6)-dimethylallyltransferase MiaA [Janthinobacterium lividum]
MQKVLILCGPTASGKTNLAHCLALMYNGEIINIDSMQIYKNIPNITASPNLELTSELPYHLYNFQDVENPCSMVQYSILAIDKIKEVTERKKLPIIVGGTGMYINSLLYGYSNIPEISQEVKAHTKELHNKLGQKEFFALLSSKDHASGVKLDQYDIQRSIRAYEVLLQTEQPISLYHQENKSLPGEFSFEVIFLLPERSFLYNLCNKRLLDIFSRETIDEIEALQASYPNLNTPAMKAIGIYEIKSYLKNIISFEEAITQAQIRTRRYAKRQITWFTHQIEHKQTLQYDDWNSYQNLINNIKL